jgi:hypothetical protein
VAAYELVAPRDFDIGDGTPHVGFSIPGPGDSEWAVVRIEEVEDSLLSGGPTDKYLRLVCGIRP